MKEIQIKIDDVVFTFQFKKDKKLIIEKLYEDFQRLIPKSTIKKSLKKLEFI